MSKIKLTKPSPYSRMVYNLIENNSLLVKTVNDQQVEISYLNVRIQGFLEYIKKHCKEKKVRKDLH